MDIAGEILHTPGHSEDSVSLLLDDGRVFTGDLTDPMMVGPEDLDVVRASWQLMKDRGATHMYAARSHSSTTVARRVTEGVGLLVRGFAKGWNVEFSGIAA